MKRSEAGLKGERETISISLVISKKHFMFLEGQSIFESTSRSALIRQGIDLLIANPPLFGVGVADDPEVKAERLKKNAEMRLHVERQKRARVERRCANCGKLRRKGETNGR